MEKSSLACCGRKELEKHLFGSFPKNPFLVVISKKSQPIPYELYGVLVGVPRIHLKGAVRGPHEALCPIGLKQAFDEGVEVVVGRGGLAKRIEGRELYFEVGVMSQSAYGGDIGVGNVASCPDSAKVINHNRGLWKGFAHVVDDGEDIRIAEYSHGKVFFCTALPHGANTGRVKPCFWVTVMGGQSEALYTQLFKALHFLLGMIGLLINYRNPGEGSGILGHCAEHIAVVEAVKRHLNEDNSVYAAWVGVFKQQLW